MNRAFWKGKRAFVTGHTGFKGTWLCAWLVDAGARVSGFALAPEAGSPFGDSRLKADMVSTVADIRDTSALASALDDARPDIVIHLAAQSLVRRSYEEPALTFSVNTMGTANLLDALRSSPTARAAVVVTSDKCYAAGEPSRRHTEDDPLGGDDPYSASKAGAEIVAAAYRRAFFEDEKIATARAGNVIGGGDSSRDRLVPDMLRAFDVGETARIRRPDDIRPWQHVLDPIAGYLDLAERLFSDARSFAQAWNFGPSAQNEVPVRKIADAVAIAWGDGASWSHDKGAHAAERGVLRLDSTKAARLLDWCDRIALDEAIRWTVDWHKDRASGASVRDLLARDISRYEALSA
ncbi:MAG TPA: CDP-glucose 4,6-dehydratase [Candidatus Eremiobacteraceae bacterium]|nr:CDP-glucose 4,6-dehydratase [Candidatus Eremiobacteraceae bacterium]